jgi:hypothetical protein
MGLRTRYYIKSVKETVYYENNTDAKVNKNRSIMSEIIRPSQEWPCVIKKSAGVQEQQRQKDLETEKEERRIRTPPPLSKKAHQKALQLICHWIFCPPPSLFIKPRRQINRRIRLRPIGALITMMPLAPASRFPRTIRSLVVLATSTVGIIFVSLLFFSFLGRGFARRTTWRQVKLHRFLTR